MSVPLQLRDAILADLRQDLPVLRSVEGHGGRIDAAELSRIATLTPALRLACIDLPLATSTGRGRRRIESQWVAFVIVDDRGAPTDQTRDDSAMDLAWTLAEQLSFRRWRLPSITQDAIAPTSIKPENLYSGTINKRGVALWAVSWSQTITINARTQ